MQVRITIPLYKCAPDGHTVRSFPEGSILTGLAAEYALQDGAGEIVEGTNLETKITPPTEAKRRGRPRK